MGKTSRKKDGLLRCVAIIGICLVIASGVYIYCDRKGRADSEALYDQMALVAEKKGAVVQNEESKASLEKKDAGKKTETPSAPVNTLPVTESSIDFEALEQVNSDVVAWIQCDDTPIHYPVAQGKDNSYYLKHLFDKRTSSTGCIFLDATNESDFSSQNSIIYGHHSDKNYMFASLVKYRRQAYYDQHPVIDLFTPGCDYKIELFAGFVIDPRSRTAPYYHISFADGETFLQYVDKLKELSDFSSDVTVEETDRLLTLSTCSYEFVDARYVLVGKLVPIALHEPQSQKNAQ